MSYADDPNLTEATDTCGKTFLCSYIYAGSQYSFQIKAGDFDEAQGHVLAIRGTGKVDGELMGTIPAGPGARWFVRALVALRNWLSAR